jgi:hypothetical protein
MRHLPIVREGKVVDVISIRDLYARMPSQHLHDKTTLPNLYRCMSLRYRC